jgi:hypothetical protein
MPDPMNPQPGFLQEIICLEPAHRVLSPEKSQQSGAEGANQSSRGFGVRLLVARHQTVEVSN